MLSILKFKVHPSLRPILLGITGFAVLNVLFTLGVTFSPLNSRFNLRYGNFLPLKISLLKQIPINKPYVLFLGTSQTNNGFIPRVFDQTFGQGLQSFNLGLPNNRYDIMLAYLKYHQTKAGKPRLLLVEVSPSIQEQDASFYYLPALYYRTLIEQAPSLTARYLQNPLIADNVKKELVFSGFSSLWQYRHTFSPVNLLGKVSQKLPHIINTTETHSGKISQASTNPSALPAQSDSTAAASKEKQPSYDTRWTARGWYPQEQSPNMTNPEGLKQSIIEARKYYIDSQNKVSFAKLQMLLQYCQSQKIPFILITWPNHPAYLETFAHSHLNQGYQQGLQALLAKNSNTTFINLNQYLPTKELTAPTHFFADPRHLTPSGAQFFSQKLAETLKTELGKIKL